MIADCRYCPAQGRELDVWFYLLAALCGIGAGWADVAINDLLFTALLVLASCMLLGLLRPRWPWRWVVVVGVFIPLTEVGRLFYAHGEADAGAGVWIVPRVSFRGLRGVMAGR